MDAAYARADYRILVVDDDPTTHALFRSVLTEQAEGTRPVALPTICRTGDDADGSPKCLPEFIVQGAEALVRVREAVVCAHRFAAAFVAAQTPSGWSGLETAARLQILDPEMPIVVFIEANGFNSADVVTALGESDNLLVYRKPLDVPALRLLIRNVISRQHGMQINRHEMLELRQWSTDAKRVLRILERSHTEMEAAHMALREHTLDLSRRMEGCSRDTTAMQDLTIFALAKLAESRDPETGEHLERIREYCRVLADELGNGGPYAERIDATFCSDLYRSSPLHDIGKVGIPDQILLKPGALTSAEFEIMKRHTVIGADALRESAMQSEQGVFLRMAEAIARHHHERFDGSGYPDGLAGEAIPLAACIVALADVFDALTSIRIYKDAVAPDTARLLIDEQVGGHFDPLVAEAFCRRWDDVLAIHHASHYGRGLASELHVVTSCHC